MEGHKSTYQRLEELRDLTLRMGEGARDLVERSTQAFLKHDVSLAADVLAADGSIDDLELEIDEKVVEIFALSQPIATDLRSVVTVAKIAPIIERIADHAGNIASATIEFPVETKLPADSDVSRMASRATEMLNQALAAFRDRDAVSARIVVELDREIDSLYRKTTRDLVRQVGSDEATALAIPQIFFVSKNLERIGDYVKDICEHTVYMIDAEFIKHRFDKAV